jgi:hypothetical protein
MSTIRIDRNGSCPHASGNKCEKCRWLKNNICTHPAVPPEVLRKFEQHRLKEIKRQQLFGKTRPIIHTDHGDWKFVAVGSQVHYSKKWKTFPDFLIDYMGAVLGDDWGNAELKKPFAERHQIVKWYHEMRRHQLEQQADDKGICRSVPNGAFAAYLLLVSCLGNTLTKSFDFLED